MQTETIPAFFGAPFLESERASGKVLKKEKWFVVICVNNNLMENNLVGYAMTKIIAKFYIKSLMKNNSISIQTWGKILACAELCVLRKMGKTNW